MPSVSSLWTNILVKKFVPFMSGKSSEMHMKSKAEIEPGMFDKEIRHIDGQLSQWNDKKMSQFGNSMMLKSMPRMPRRITNCNGCG
eukprot:12120390-Karenia_brevis.AAC.1